MLEYFLLHVSSFFLPFTALMVPKLQPSTSHTWRYRLKFYHTFFSIIGKNISSEIKHYFPLNTWIVRTNSTWHCALSPPEREASCLMIILQTLHTDLCLVRQNTLTTRAGGGWGEDKRWKFDIERKNAGEIKSILLPPTLDLKFSSA